MSMKMKLFLASFFGVVITWIINHPFGLGAFIANGFVGVTSAILLPAPLAVAAFCASFVTMSSAAVIGTLSGAIVGGIVFGLLWIVTLEVYAGIGGKGGTVAFLSAVVTRFIMKLLG